MTHYFRTTSVSRNDEPSCRVEAASPTARLINGFDLWAEAALFGGKLRRATVEALFIIEPLGGNQRR